MSSVGVTNVRDLLLVIFCGLLVSTISLAQSPRQGQAIKAEAEAQEAALRSEAEQGDATAQLRLGMMYYIGNVIPQNYDEAAKWFRMAAEQANPEAMFRYGCMLYYGRGVERELVSAHMWFNLAAAAEFKAADDYREMVAEKMTPQEISEAQKLARNWKPKTK